MNKDMEKGILGVELLRNKDSIDNMSTTLNSNRCYPRKTLRAFLLGLFSGLWMHFFLLGELSSLLPQNCTVIREKTNTTTNNDSFLFSSLSQENETSTTPTSSQPTSLSSHFPLLQSRDQTAVMCLAMKDDEAYLEEWIDYHYALGFSYFYIYINEDYFYFEKWLRYRPHRAEYIKFIHHPGEDQQKTIYQDCAGNLMETGIYANDHHTWVAFLDSDEFIVLKQHTHIVDMLQQYCPSGALALNWIVMGQDDSDQYSPIPLTKRCQHRHEEPNEHVKSIVRINDLDLAGGFSNPHFFPLKGGMGNKDTNGNEFYGPFNVNRPVDVAAIYHYQYKSRKEYIKKRERGTGDRPFSDSMTQPLIALARQGFYSETPFSVYDDTAWKFLKTNVPKYAIFDVWE